MSARLFHQMWAALWVVVAFSYALGGAALVVSGHVIPGAVFFVCGTGCAVFALVSLGRARESSTGSQK